MEGNPTSDGSLIPGDQASGFLETQGSLQFHQELNPQFHQQGSQFQDTFTFGLENMKESEKPYEKVKKLAIDNDGIHFDEGGADGFYDGCKEKRASLWQRVKWTREMVKLLINAVYYIEEDISSDGLGGVRKKPTMLQKIGKWRCVSRVMVERGYHVSPQQCEDKFNDLNKKYKRLNDVLGRGTSCKVVENPKLLEIMDISDKVKEEVKRILSSKNLFYEEMCSYHTGNRLHLPHDPEVQRSLQLALRGRDNNDPIRSKQRKGDDDFEKEVEDVGADDQIEDAEDNRGAPWCPELSSMTPKEMNEMQDAVVGNPMKIKEYRRKSKAVKQDNRIDVDSVVYLNDSSADGLRQQWMAFRLLQLKEQKLRIQVQKHELEKQRLKWRRINWNKDMDLDKMRWENECMKLENEHLAFELKHKKMSSV